jgi:hypothetical protein
MRTHINTAYILIGVGWFGGKDPSGAEILDEASEVGVVGGRGGLVDLGFAAGADADHGMGWGRGKLALLGYSLCVHGCLCVAHPDTERERERERERENMAGNVKE